MPFEKGGRVQCPRYFVLHFPIGIFRRPLAVQTFYVPDREARARHADYGENRQVKIRAHLVLSFIGLNLGAFGIERNVVESCICRITTRRGDHLADAHRCEEKREIEFICGSYCCR